DHPELERARALGLPVVRRADALGELVAAGRASVAVAGTHGKTTTTVMVTEALTAAGRNPTGLAGGRVAAWGGNARIGGDGLFGSSPEVRGGRFPCRADTRSSCSWRCWECTTCATRLPRSVCSRHSARRCKRARRRSRSFAAWAGDSNGWVRHAASRWSTITRITPRKWLRRWRRRGRRFPAGDSSPYFSPISIRGRRCMGSRWEKRWLRRTWSWSHRFTERARSRSRA